MRHLRNTYWLALPLALLALSACQAPTDPPVGNQERQVPIQSALNSVWQIQGSSGSFGKHACELNDGNIVIVGSTNLGPDQSSLYLASHSAQGVLNWDSTFAEYETTNGTHVAQLRDGSILVITTTRDGGLALMNLSTAGAVRWTNTYEKPQSRYIPKSIKATPDGGVILCGLNDIAYADDDGFVLKLDKSGNLEWEHSVAGDEPDVAEAIHLTVDGSGDLLISGHKRQQKESGNDDLFVTRYAQDGGEVWSKEYATNSFLPGMGISFDQGNNRYIVTAGQSYDTETQFAGKFIYLDGGGNELERRYHKFTQSFPQSVFATDSGFFLHEHTSLHFVGADEARSAIFSLPEVGQYEYFLTRLTNGDFLVVGSNPPFADGAERRLLLRRYKI